MWTLLVHFAIFFPRRCHCITELKALHTDMKSFCMQIIMRMHKQIAKRLNWRGYLATTTMMMRVRCTQNAFAIKWIILKWTRFSQRHDIHLCHFSTIVITIFFDNYRALFWFITGKIIHRVFTVGRILWVHHCRKCWWKLFALSVIHPHIIMVALYLSRESRL